MTWTRASVIKNYEMLWTAKNAMWKLSSGSLTLLCFKQLKSKNNEAAAKVNTHSYSMKGFTFVIPIHPAWYLVLVNPNKHMNYGHQIRAAGYVKLFAFILNSPPTIISSEFHYLLLWCVIFLSHSSKFLWMKNQRSKTSRTVCKIRTELTEQPEECSQE